MARNRSLLEKPMTRRTRFRMPNISQETVGRVSERFARAMGTGAFLIFMTVFVALWLSWNTLASQGAQFDPRALNFTLLTLILSYYQGQGQGSVCCKQSLAHSPSEDSLSITLLVSVGIEGSRCLIEAVNVDLRTHCIRRVDG